LELVFYAIGYATAWLLVPVFTFGHVTVEPSTNGKRLRPRRGRIQRIAPGKYLREVEGAAHVDLHRFGGDASERRVSEFIARHLRQMPMDTIGSSGSLGANDHTRL
jgi:hypothetical protein